MNAVALFWNLPCSAKKSPIWLRSSFSIRWLKTVIELFKARLKQAETLEIGISEAKMMDCIIRLGQDVRIVIGHALNAGQIGRVEVAHA